MVANPPLRVYTFELWHHSSFYSGHLTMYSWASQSFKIIFAQNITKVIHFQNLKVPLSLWPHRPLLTGIPLTEPLVTTSLFQLVLPPLRERSRQKIEASIHTEEVVFCGKMWKGSYGIFVVFRENFADAPWSTLWL